MAQDRLFLTRPVIWLLLPLLALLLALSTTWASEPARFDASLEQWERSAQHAEAGLADDFREVDLDATKARLQAALREIAAFRATAQEELDRARGELAELGEPPTDSQEDAAVAELRAQADERVARLAGQVTRSGRMKSRVSELLANIARLEQARFREQLFSRGPSPVQAETWRAAWHVSIELSGAVGDAFAGWWRDRGREGLLDASVIPAVIMPFFGLLVGWLVRLWIIRHLARDPDDDSPTYARRIIGAVGDGLANAVIPAAVVALLMVGLRQQGLLAGDFGFLMAAIGLAIAAYLMVKGITRAALSPSLVAWRIVPVEPAHANGLWRAIRGLAVTLAASFVLMLFLLRTGIYSASLDAVFILLQTLVVALLGGWALRPDHWARSMADSQAAGGVDEAVAEETGARAHEGAATGDRVHWLHRMRALLRLVIVLAPLAALAGYSRFAYFVQSRVLATAALVGFALLVGMAVREVLERCFEDRKTGSATDRDREQSRPVRGIVFWSSMGANAVLLLVLVYAILLIHGVPSLAIGMWMQSILSGVEIGGVTIAPVTLFKGLLLLSATLLLTNIVRRWLRRHVLPNTRLDYGARNSVLAGTTYLGVGVAVVLALSSLGLNFTNVALIAGALSLGIGFGLRNAVENFAAGLLLLIERPIKVGDWVVVGATEGTVRHISVRATEIETFDRASVIVPNSELVSSAVTNWTHKHRIARIIVKVRVAYDSDTELVVQTLLDCANRQPKILATPPPMALLLGFGESSLNFELRAFIGDADDFLVALSDLHLAVHTAFRGAGIVIPFPQQEMHFRTEGRETDGVPPLGRPNAASWERIYPR